MVEVEGDIIKYKMVLGERYRNFNGKISMIRIFNLLRLRDQLFSLAIQFLLTKEKCEDDDRLNGLQTKSPFQGAEKCHLIKSNDCCSTLVELCNITPDMEVAPLERMKETEM